VLAQSRFTADSLTGLLALLRALRKRCSPPAATSPGASERGAQS